jgi:hypothetical protein
MAPKKPVAQRSSRVAMRPAVLKAGEGDRDAVALAVERLAGRDCLRFCFGRMQAVMPRSARAARNVRADAPHLRRGEQERDGQDGTAAPQTHNCPRRSKRIHGS